MQLKLVLTTFCLSIVYAAFAQKSERVIKQPTSIQTINSNQNGITDTIRVDYSKNRTKQLSSISVENTSVINNQSILQELYTIEDERNIIEKDNSLSSSERRNRIYENNSKYKIKKAEFIEYVNSKGVLNISKKEQSYFLSILKSDNNISEYNKNIELINQSN